jgi:hypothetical protein
LGLTPDQIDALVDFLENGLYDPAFVRFDPTSSTDTFEPNERDLTYSDELHVLGAVDGLLPSHMNIGSNDALSRRDRGLEFLDVTDRLTMQMDGSPVPAASGTMMQRMVLTNQSKDPIDGDLVLVMTEMPAGAVLMNAEGYATHMPGLVGMPYLRVRFMDGQLAAGASMPVDLHLQMPGPVTGGYSLRILSGAGAP